MKPLNKFAITGCIILVALILLVVGYVTTQSENKVVRIPTLFSENLSGVRHWNKEKAFSGVTEMYCSFVDMAGQFVFKILGSQCFIVPELGVHFAFLKIEGEIGLFKGNALIWSKNVGAHHDGVVHPKTQDFYTLITRPILHRGKTVFHDGVEAYNLEGKKIFSWYSWEHTEELKNHVTFERDDLMSNQYVDDEGRNIGNKVNSVDVLVDHPEKDRNPVFEDGNVILSLNHSSSLIIVSRKTGEILWSYRLSKDIFQGAHSVRFNNNGNLIFFENRGLVPGHGDVTRARVVELDPISKERVWSHPKIVEEAMTCPSGCSAYELPNSNILISYQPNKSVVEITRDGEIVWEWFSQRQKANGLRQDYKNVKRFTNEDIKKFQEMSMSF